jgi:tight adherence protein B
MKIRAIGAAITTALLLLALGATGAAAATDATIDKVDVVDGQLRIVVSLNDVPEGVQIGTDQLQASLDGAALNATVDSVSSSGGLSQTALLVMDTSDSMRGQPLQAAKAAANDFVAGVPDSVKVGLITFDNQATVDVKPTTDRGTLTSAIDGLTTAPKTVLYDAVTLAADELSSAELGYALVLSDGADRGSQVTLAQATKDAKQSGSRFDAVSFGDSQAQNSALAVITKAGGGQVFQATDAEALSNAFQSVASSISNSYVVTADIPEGFSATSGNVAVSIPVDGAAITDAATVTFGKLPTGPQQTTVEVTEPSSLASASAKLIYVALAALFVSIAVLLFVAISASNKGESGTRGVRRRLSIYTLRSGQQPVKEQETTVLGDTQVARSAVEFADRVVAQRDMESVLAQKLDAAAVPLKPAEWLLIHVGITVASAILFMLLFSVRFIPSLLGLVLGFLGPLLYLSYKESKRKKAFMAALPDTLQLMAGSLSAGYSMPQAVDTVVRESNPPISTEFNRALVEARLGVDLEDALDGVAERMQSVDFGWVVMAIRIQREVGGNLAEVLTTVSATLRERERLRRQVQVLSAEGRLSAWILGALPVVFAAYLILAQPEYLLPMIQTVFGWLMIGVGFVLLVVGALWLRKTVKVEV